MANGHTASHAATNKRKRKRKKSTNKPFEAECCLCIRQIDVAHYVKPFGFMELQCQKALGFSRYS